MKKVIIYTDGACSGNPGPGGWGAVLSYKSAEKELSGYEADTTNNRMELMAAIQAMQALKEACEVQLYTDSAYLCNAYNQHWIDSWQVKNWKTAAGKPVENQDLWKALLSCTNKHRVTFHKVKGHSDNKKNNRCDELARLAIRSNGQKTVMDENGSSTP